MQPDAQPLLSSAAAARDVHKQATTWLALSVASSIFCLSLGLGIGGAVFCYLAMQSSAQGLTEDAEAKLKWGKILTVVGSALGVLTALLLLIFR